MQTRVLLRRFRLVIRLDIVIVVPNSWHIVAWNTLIVRFFFLVWLLYYPCYFLIRKFYLAFRNLIINFSSIFRHTEKLGWYWCWCVSILRNTALTRTSCCNTLPQRRGNDALPGINLASGFLTKGRRICNWHSLFPHFLQVHSGFLFNFLLGTVNLNLITSTDRKYFFYHVVKLALFNLRFSKSRLHGS